MRLIKLSITILSLFLSVLIYAAESGFIRGVVFDNATGESLPGVAILVEGTTTGTTTDLDGKFNLKIPAGTYTLKLSYISYEALIIKEVQVTDGEVVMLDNLRLNEAAIELSAATVTAERVHNTENALLSIKRISPNMLDGISSANFRKIGDSDAASSMKRITGVSVTGGKYVYVRGLGDRYTKTILNGVDIPGLDPDRNSMQMDIFPNNLIDNIIVYKSFTPELPADFTGGVVDIAIKDFPEEKKGSVSFNAGYNPDAHFNNDYLTYDGGKTDFLGFDDGTRKIPATSNIPLFVDALVDQNGAAGTRYKEIIGSFNPTMAAYRQRSSMDYGFGASMGNQIVREKVTLGYNFAFSYKNNTEFFEDAEYGRYGLGNENVNEMELREYQIGDYGTNNTLLSGIAGFAIKTRMSKIRLSLLHLQNGESKAGIFDFVSNNQGSEFSVFQHNLEYSQRSLTNILLEGKHSRYESKWDLEWKLAPTLSRMYDPDVRFVRYLTSSANYEINTESGFPERIWRELDEYNLAGLLNITKGFKFRGESAKLKFGGAYSFKERDFIIRSFAINVRNIPLTGDPDELFKPENIWPVNGNLNSGTTYDAPFIPNNPNQFNANAGTAAGYISTELNLFKSLKTIFGARVENYVQRYTGQNQLFSKILDNDKVIDDLDVFYSFNLIFTISPKQNMRFSYATTIARPSFKEMSYAEIYDPISGRTFFGGLSPDRDPVNNTTYWDGNLTSTYIHNYDLRWELFQSNGQTVSVSGFYKKFDDPIEVVQYATQEGSFQPRNVGDGEVFGAEFEFRQSFGSILNSLKNLTLTTNLTFTKSRIKLGNTEFDSRVLHARTDQTIDEYRDMAGQAPYIINMGLAYGGGEKGFRKGLELGLYYNVQGPTLQYVGIADRPDVYAKPFHSLNFNSNKTIGKNERVQVGFKIENILNEKNESVYKSFKAKDQYFTRLKPGMTFQARISYSLF